MRTPFALLPAATFVLAACTSSALGGGDPPAGLQSAAAQPADEDLDVARSAPPGEQGILKIQSRDRAVTVFAAHNGVRLVTVEDAQGRIIAHRVDVDALERLDASAYQLLKSAFASRGGGGAGAADVR